MLRGAHGGEHDEVVPSEIDVISTDVALAFGAVEMSAELLSSQISADGAEDDDRAIQLQLRKGRSERESFAELCRAETLDSELVTYLAVVIHDATEPYELDLPHEFPGPRRASEALVGDELIHFAEVCALDQSLDGHIVVHENPVRGAGTERTDVHNSFLLLQLGVGGGIASTTGTTSIILY